MKKAKPKPADLRGRDAQSGQFMPVELARKRSATSVVERIPAAPIKKKKR